MGKRCFIQKLVRQTLLVKLKIGPNFIESYLAISVKRCRTSSSIWKSYFVLQIHSHIRDNYIYEDIYCSIDLSIYKKNRGSFRCPPVDLLVIIADVKINESPSDMQH
jgi:hypothetical protein